MRNVPNAGGYSDYNSNYYSDSDDIMRNVRQRMKLMIITIMVIIIMEGS